MYIDYCTKLGISANNLVNIYNDFINVQSLLKLYNINGNIYTITFSIFNNRYIVLTKMWTLTRGEGNWKEKFYQC
jgi:CMP-N-acetylneuraminic acid synthetase